MIQKRMFTNLDLIDVLDAPGDAIAQFKSELNGRNVIIYGAGIVGVTLFRALRFLDIAVSLIVDRNADEISEIEGIAVHAPGMLKRVSDPENNLLIIAASAKPAKSIISDLIALNLKIDVIENGAKITDVLQCAVCALRLNMGENVDHAKCSDCSILDNICPALRKCGMNLIGFKSGENRAAKSGSVTMIGYVLGNICTLNCKHCCESVSMYPKERRGFVDTQTVIADIERLAHSAEFITLIEFVGGEPFLHPGLPEIVRCVLQIPNAAFVRIFTNGTVVPSEELLSVLANPRAAVYISNYTGMLSDAQVKSLAETRQALTEAKAAFIHGVYKKWFDFSSYDFQPDSYDELSRRFNACFLHNCNRLHKGVLYACPHHYAGRTLKILETSDDIVNIHDWTDTELVKSLEVFKNRPFVEACKYCQMPFNAPMILAGGSVNEI